MKKIGLFIATLLLASASIAAVSVDVGIKTGDAELDLHLRSTNNLGSTPAGMIEAHKYIATNYWITEKEVSFLHKQGYTLAEIEYLALLARQSGKPINKIVALRGQGVGWGVLAHRLGVKPSALRKMIVQHKKAEKMQLKQEKMTPRPGLSQPKNTPLPGGGKGHGRGR
ncbi:MAG: hypothetical protein WC405_20160 [Syntrophales bacterium]